MKLLEEALTTPAYAKQHECASYERLEYLGDAVIKLVIAETLFNAADDKDQDEMTRVRNILESNRVLAGRAVELDLMPAIQSLVPIKPSETGILADIVEALCGALYIDAGRDRDVPRRLIIQPILDRVDEIVEESPDFNKNLFIEAVQRIFGFTPVIEMDYTDDGPDHDKRFGCRNLRVINPRTDHIVLTFQDLSTPTTFKQRKEAEKVLLKMAFDRWQATDFSVD